MVSFHECLPLWWYTIIWFVMCFSFIYDYVNNKWHYVKKTIGTYSSWEAFICECKDLEKCLSFVCRKQTNKKNNKNKFCVRQARSYRMFHDDSMKSFFRRLSFTPDGSLLLTPGVFRSFGLKGMMAEWGCLLPFYAAAYQLSECWLEWGSPTYLPIGTSRRASKNTLVPMSHPYRL